MTSVGQPASSNSNNWRLSLATAVLALAFVASTPAAARAQSSIAGVVTDTSGALLPGVTVEAASPALIEKVRTAVTDSQGVYRIVDLRPGVYAVTFTLPGFATFRRDGLELPAAFVATVNAELRVGAVEETVTVSGAAPVVDVQSTQQAQVLSNDVLDAVPTSNRMPQLYTLFVPGVVLGAGGQQGLGNSSNILSIHGSRAGETNVAVDGILNRDATGTGGQSFYYYVNQGTVQEVAVITGSGGAETQMGGIVTNVIPKEGGNQLSGQFYVHYTNEDLLGNNLTDELRALGVTATTSTTEQWDVNPSVGGPIMRDKLWFFGSYRTWGAAQAVGIPYNLTPTAWTYTPDPARPRGENRVTDRSYYARLTWQASQRNKIGFLFDWQPHYIFNRDIIGTVSPEATTYSPITENYNTHLTWKSPLSNRLFVDAGLVYTHGTLWQHPNTKDELLRQCPCPDPNAVSALELTTNRRMRAAARYGNFGGASTTKARAAASYVTGTHTVKVGMDFQAGTEKTDHYRNGDYHVNLRNGVPVSLNLFAREAYQERVNADLGVFAQDQWSLRRMTINAGVRYDYASGSVLEQPVPGNRFVPARTFERVDGVPVWHDISPRLGVSYDLFGTGRTALKASFNGYVAGFGGPPTTANPQINSVPTAERNWTDRNGDFLPDCDFGNPAANGECGALSDLNFGRLNPNATRTDPDVLEGWAKRGYSWETSVGIQHEVLTGLSANVSYHRRWYTRFTATDNEAVTPADFNTFCITLPRHPRLPGGGGNEQCGFSDVAPAKFGQLQNLVTFADKFGGERSEHFDGVDMTLRARIPNGPTFSGGVSVGRTVINSCQLIDQPLAPLAAGAIAAAPAEWCEYSAPFQPNIKFLGVVPLPWDFQVSGAFQSVPGPEITATLLATNAQVQPSLGRPLSGGRSTVLLPIMPGGTAYDDRLNKLDARFSRVLNVGRSRFLASLDVFNLLNSSAPILLNTRVGPSWLTPTQNLGARLFRLSGQVDF